MRNTLGLKDPDSYLMSVLNGYLYVGMKLTPKMIWSMLMSSTFKAKKMIGDSTKRWAVLRDDLSRIVNQRKVIDPGS